VIAVKRELDVGKVGEWTAANLEQSHSLSKFSSQPAAMPRSREGNLSGSTPKMRLQRDPVRSYRVDIVTPVVLTAALDFRTLL
jgi:hypothetical protein